MHGGRPPNAGSRPSTFSSSALSPPLETVARRPFTHGWTMRACCEVGRASQSMAASRLQSAHQRRGGKRPPSLVRSPFAVTAHEVRRSCLSAELTASAAVRTERGCEVSTPLRVCAPRLVTRWPVTGDESHVNLVPACTNVGGESLMQERSSRDHRAPSSRAPHAPNAERATPVHLSMGRARPGPRPLPPPPPPPARARRASSPRPRRAREKQAHSAPAYCAFPLPSTSRCS
jgi:hypothetical protein